MQGIPRQSRDPMNRHVSYIFHPACLILLVVSLSACRRPAKSPDTEAGSASQSESGGAPIVLVSTPAPTPSNPNPATPEPNNFTPDGIYFLTTRISVPSDDGVVGLRPGTRVVRQPDSRYLADGHILDIPAAQLTNDLRVAARIAGADQTAQTVIRQALQQKASPQTTPEQPGKANNQRPAAQYRPPTAPTPKYVPGVNTQNNLQTSTALGATHTRTDDGILWQRSPDGAWWVPVKRLDGKLMGYVPKRPAR